MPRFGLTIGTLVLLAGCEKSVSIPGEELPQINVSTNRVNFGAVEWGETVYETITISNTGLLPLGLSNIELGVDEMEDNFALHLGREVYCATSPLPSISDTGLIDIPTSIAGADASLISTITLEKGCSYDFFVSMSPTSVGDIFGSVLIETSTATGEEPAYHADPDTARSTIILQGSTSKGAGRIIVSPRTVDFAHPSPGAEVTQYVEFYNVGNGPLRIDSPIIEADCDDSFSFDFARFESGPVVLDAYTSTLVPITYTASTSGNAECEISIQSDDLGTPTSLVSLRGQMGTDPLCSPPSVTLISPEPGTTHGTTEDLVLELAISDAEQSPTTLFCEVKSTFNIEEEGAEPPTLADCKPYAESGYTLVPIPVSDLLEGTDTLIVTVKDGCGYRAHTSVSVVWNAPYPEHDDDKDGFADGPIADADCDDDDKWVYPYAVEIADGKDNDCDGDIDEDTDGYDDDGDGYSEAEGDCNDFDDVIFPGAPEQPDYKDNDCDGIVDDRTSLYDDDGDGFAESDNDCADSNPEVHPAAIEYCDGIDNNCNGLMDARDGCIPTDAAPMILGEIQMKATAIGSGESTVMTVEVYDPDGTEFIFSWQEDEALIAAGHSGFDSVTTQTVTWTAPIVEADEGETYSMYVEVSDTEGHADYAVGEITVMPEPVDGFLGGFDESDDDKGKGCGKDDDDDDGAASAALLTPLLLLFGLRRRKDD